jgi:acylpyruvate hydrolase
MEMRFMAYREARGRGLAALIAGQEGCRGLLEGDPGFPGDLEALIAAGPDALRAAFDRLRQGAVVDEDSVEILPPLSAPPKIICVGLNYADHSAESGFEQPDYPTLFPRFASSMIGHGAPMIRPRVSQQLDYEGELVAVIGQRGRHISKPAALGHVAGYTICNEGSIRDYQFKSPQWTMGKNFDGTGAFGPIFVTADELPLGCKGLRLQTRLNGQVVQDASTDDMVFNVETLVSVISEGITLEPGDLIVTGTPAGVGLARKPPLWMKPGDVCEVEIERLGTLRNPIADEAASLQSAA